ncbi:phosphorothioated DNA-binding restriction endonuclease [Paenibacillus sp. S150]|uniref:phosphorothioated DNA-binding restriction endonuclease n=1 Tax=Paenibacillus sp. S150 TaxID=2749826 RepID=UPI001C597191|nr:HNH endonuclease [Paenibacillus sp. S150]MBW4081277.1 HNH endonuclease [Paenibacillus sp. S150]
MTSDELKARIANLTIWKKNGQRAPHKPLLILYALARLQHNSAILPYVQTREKLKSLLIEFGPCRKSYHPEEPFVRLETDGIWELNILIDKRNFTDRQLVSKQATGGFRPEVLALLTNNEKLIQELAEQLLNEHFSETMHQDILEEIGLDFSVSRKRRSRDPDFRARILKAYEYSCAICGFNVRLGHNLVAIDAAHIQWHQAGGPDVEENGIALCSLHHKLFDRGVFTINEERKMIVAETAHGSQGFEEWLMRYHDKVIKAPIHPGYQPKSHYIDWHMREVFRGPGRYQVK